MATAALSPAMSAFTNLAMRASDDFTLRMSLQSKPQVTAETLALEPKLKEAVASRSPLKVRQAAFSSANPQEEPVVYTVTLVVILAAEAPV